VLYQIAVLGFYALRAEYIAVGFVLAAMIGTMTLYCCVSFRRKKFLKKQQKRIDQIYTNNDVESSPLASHSTEALPYLLRKQYMHPSLNLVDPIEVIENFK